MSPQYAKPGEAITLRGTLTNHTGSALSGLSVQVETDTLGFQTQAQMTAFEQSNDSLPYQVGVPSAVSGTLANGATTHWQVTFSPGTLYTAAQIEVYPLAVVAFTPASTDQATSRTFLPYWPGKGGGTPLQVSWVMPLIDTPQQGACKATLASNSLASSIATGGRLSTLLTTAVKWSKPDDLTWAIDPALVSDVSVMTKPYSYRGEANCTGRLRAPASSAASAWLTALKLGTVGESAFATPYADVDASALSHSRQDDSLHSAYASGKAVAAQLLPGTFGASAVGAGTALSAAWPADGLADSGVLTSLASAGDVKTVVLSSSELGPQLLSAPTAVYRTTTGIGRRMAVLLANQQITDLLGSITASASTSSRFAVTQDFLAQTAVILADAPSEVRSLVIAPPRNWDPSASELATLLKMTTKATPWLHVVGLAKLARQASGAVPITVPSQVRSGNELSDGYLDQQQALGASFDMFENLLYKAPGSLQARLNQAYSVTQSSAWRGSGSPGGFLAMNKLRQYLLDAEGKVRLIVGKKLLLTGTSGQTPITVQNELDTMPDLRVAVQVTLTYSTESGSPLHVGNFDSALIIPPGQSKTVTVPVRSSTVGTSTLQLQLATSNGSPLPHTSQSMSVEVTRFGRSLLVIIGGALAILVLTTVVRLRRKRLAAAGHTGSTDDNAEAGGGG